jgi:hypothetical protein
LATISPDRTTGIAAEILGPGDRMLHRIHYLNISEFIKEEAWWFAKFLQLIMTDYKAFPRITRRQAIVPWNTRGIRTIWGIRRSGWVALVTARRAPMGSRCFSLT